MASLHMQEPRPLPLDEVIRASERATEACCPLARTVPVLLGWSRLVSHCDRNDAYTLGAGRLQFSRSSAAGFDARWARRLMRAGERRLSIPEQWQEPFLQFNYSVV